MLQVGHCRRISLPIPVRSYSLNSSTGDVLPGVHKILSKKSSLPLLCPKSSSMEGELEKITQIKGNLFNGIKEQEGQILNRNTRKEKKGMDESVQAHVVNTQTEDEPEKETLFNGINQQKGQILNGNTRKEEKGMDESVQTQVGSTQTEGILDKGTQKEGQPYNWINQLEGQVLNDNLRKESIQTEKKLFLAESVQTEYIQSQYRSTQTEGKFLIESMQLDGRFLDKTTQTETPLMVKGMQVERQLLANDRTLSRDVVCPHCGFMPDEHAGKESDAQELLLCRNPVQFTCDNCEIEADVNFINKVPASVQLVANQDWNQQLAPDQERDQPEDSCSDKCMRYFVECLSCIF